MTRSFGIVAGSVLAVGAVAILFLALRGPSSDDTVRPAEPIGEPERALRAVEDGVSSVPKAPPAVVPSLASAGVGPAGIVETLETSRDPRAIEAALRAVLTTYSSRSTRKPAPDAALENAIVRHLRSDDGAVVRAALAAARVPLMTESPRPELANAIASTTSAEQTPARRTLALEALNLLRPDRRGAPVLTAIEQSLSASEPEVVSQALFALAHSGPSLATLSEANRAELGGRVQALARHHNPGVRGRALSVMAEIADLVVAEARRGAALAQLGDREPYVRAEAANLAARCGDPRAIHALMEHVGDLAPARYELAFVDVEGRPSVAEHRVPGRQRVAEAALFSILTLSRGLPLAARLELTLSGTSESDARVLENTALARAWYREVAQQIPR